MNENPKRSGREHKGIESTVSAYGRTIAYHGQTIAAHDGMIDELTKRLDRALERIARLEAANENRQTD